MTQSVPAAVAPPPGNPRFPLLDGLRAIAALSVVALHSAAAVAYFQGWAGAYLRQLASGVTVFFLLSGFLLYRPFVHARVSGRDPIRIRDYTRRRLLRIVPAYWLALTALALWPGLPGRPLHGLRYYLFLQDFHRATLFNGLGTAWSLGTEVTFYLALPFYAAVLNRRYFFRTTKRLVAFELLALTALSIGSLAFRAATAGSHPNLGYTLAGTFDWFALGMALAVISVATHGRRTGLGSVVEVIGRHPTACWLAAFGSLTVTAAYWERTRRYDAYSGGPLHYLWGLTALLLLLPAVFGHDGKGLPRQLLRAKPIAWLGLISYGIYLWHLPLIPKVARAAGISGHTASSAVAVFVLAAAVTIACAAASYYLVERPILRYKRGFRARRQVPEQPAPAALA